MSNTTKSQVNPNYQIPRNRRKKKQEGGTEILTVGAGAQAKYIIDIISWQRDKEIIGIADVENNVKIHGKKVGEVPILGSLESVLSQLSKRPKLVIAHSDNKFKEKLANELKEKGYEFESIIHPRAYISELAKIGEGVIINAHATIMPFAKIGNHVMIHSNVVVEHDNVLEDYVNLAPGVTLAGYVHVKKGAYIHTGALVIPNITIGAHSIVGAGAAVIEDVPDDVTVVGVPARIVASGEDKLSYGAGIKYDNDNKSGGKH